MCHCKTQNFVQKGHQVNLSDRPFIGLHWIHFSFMKKCRNVAYIVGLHTWHHTHTIRENFLKKVKYSHLESNVGPADITMSKMVISGTLNLVWVLLTYEIYSFIWNFVHLRFCLYCHLWTQIFLTHITFHIRAYIIFSRYVMKKF